MFLVGLTGGIASGKSLVCHMMAELGLPVVDADLIAREVVEVGSPAWKKIRDEFGMGVFLSTGELDRGKLGSIIFSDEAKRKLINSITHPEIYRRMRAQVFKHFFKGEQLVVLDLPLLFETEKALPYVHKTIVVNCEAAEQQRRLQARGGYTKAEAQARISAQMPLEEKTAQAHFVVENTGSRVYTREQVEAIVMVLRDSKQHIINRVYLCVGSVVLLSLLVVFSYWLLGVVARRMGVTDTDT